MTTYNKENEKLKYFYWFCIEAPVKARATNKQPRCQPNNNNYNNKCVLRLKADSTTIGFSCLENWK